jgi:hypothetical protein
MQQGKSKSLTLLQKDIMLLCNYYPSYKIREKWVEGRDVLTNYSTRSGYYEEESFFIGENHMTEILTNIDGLEIFNRDSLLKESVIGEEEYKKLKGLYIYFTYNYDGDTYYFCWRKNGWVDMYESDWKEKLWNEGNYLHSEYSTENGDYKFNDADGLIQELNRCISEYKKL